MGGISNGQQRAKQSHISPPVRHFAGGSNVPAEFQTQSPNKELKVFAEEVQLADANDHRRQLPLFSMATNVHP